MGGPSNQPDDGTMDNWMRRQEKRVLREERRPRITSATDLMGPGLGPRAVEIQDWSGEETEFNGYYYSRPGALHSPNNTKWWMGQSIAQVEGWGIQTVWDYRGTTMPIESHTRRFGLVGGVRVFGPWG